MQQEQDKLGFYEEIFYDQTKVWYQFAPSLVTDSFPLSPPQHFNFNGLPQHRILPPVTSLSPVCLLRRRYL